MQSAINISNGNSPHKSTVEAIMEIINSKADQETIRVALEILKTSVQPTGPVSISNCTFTSTNDKQEDE